MPSEEVKVSWNTAPEAIVVSAAFHGESVPQLVEVSYILPDFHSGSRRDFERSDIPLARGPSRFPTKGAPKARHWLWAFDMVQIGKEQ